MKKLIIMLFILVFSFPAFAEEVWNIASLEWPPYASSSNKDGGTFWYKFSEAMKAEGVTIKVNYLPWERVKKESKEGVYIGYGPCWPEEVKEGFISTGTIEYSEIAIISKATHNFDLNPENPTLTFGIVKTYDYPVKVINNIESYGKIVSTPMEDRLLARMLESEQRFNLSVTDFKVAQHYVNTEKLSPIKKIKVLDTIPLVIAIANKPENQNKIEIIKRVTEKLNKGE